MKEEKGLLSNLDSSFTTTRNSVGNLMGKMDDGLGKASNSIFCYVAVFTVMIVAMLIKFT